MPITSLSFLVFIFSTLILYYLVPKRFQWIVLLAASLCFYLSFGFQHAIYIVITATTVYAATRLMDGITVRQKQELKEHKEDYTKEQKKALKQTGKKKRKTVLICTLLLNLGILCVFKYYHFALEQMNAILALTGVPQIQDRFHLIVPLGISFYTFQTIGYLVNVYWENWPAEKNYLKVLLFTSFFPQITQGPISEYDQLSKELFSEHTFSYHNYSWGFQRMLWGFLKKMVLADMLNPYVQDVFANYSQYSGVTVFIGALAYSVQIYADFSGYMDIMCGYCEMLGIHLTENFERPYFSKSVAEYWRRWHISLGAWFKSYIYYPIGISKWNNQLGKRVRQRFGKAAGSNLPASLALVVVWLATGLWHGASWAYVAWGGVNGLFIIFSLWMEPVYDKWKHGLHIRENAWLWRAFQTIRTFLLVTFIKVLPEVGTLSDGIGLWKQVFTSHTIPATFSQLLPFVDKTRDFAVIIVCTVVLFVFSLLQRKKPVREYFAAVPLPIRIVVLSCMFLVIVVFGVPASRGGGFMYAQF